MRIVLAAALAVLIPSLASAAEPYVGKWAANPGWCKNSAETSDKIPIRITAKVFEGLENYCDIKKVSKAGANYDMSLSCAAEGDTYKERVRVTVDANRMTIVYPERKGAKTDFVRCP